jgi:hypothetical protein
MIDGVHYSVPDRLVNQNVAVKMYSERIVVLAGERNRDKVATHTRSRHSGDWKIDLMHYLGTFMRKPAAPVRHILPLLLVLPHATPVTPYYSLPFHVYSLRYANAVTR